MKTRLQPAWCIALLAAAGLHLGLLSGGPNPPPVGTGLAQHPHLPQSLRVRLQADSAQAMSLAGAAAPLAAPAATTIQTPSAARNTPTAQSAPPEDALWDQLYLPRTALTRPPSVEGPLELAYPLMAPLGHWRARLTLFINADGQVQRVRVDEAESVDTAGAGAPSPARFPAALEDSARQTFLQARFTPGELDDRPTASRLRIEVEFAAEQGPTEPQTSDGTDSACALTPPPAPADAPPRCARAS